MARDIFYNLGVNIYRWNGSRTPGGYGDAYNMDQVLLIISQAILLEDKTSEAGGFLFMFDTGKRQPDKAEVRKVGGVATISSLFASAITPAAADHEMIQLTNLLTLNGRTFNTPTNVAVNNQRIFRRYLNGDGNTVVWLRKTKGRPMKLTVTGDQTG